MRQERYKPSCGPGIPALLFCNTTGYILNSAKSFLSSSCGAGIPARLFRNINGYILQFGQELS